MNATRWGAIIGAVVLVLALLGWQRVQYQRLQGRVATLALEKSNALALADSTRAVVLKLSDSLHAVQKLAVQTGKVADSLDAQLGLERKALSDARVEIRTLKASSASTGPVHVLAGDVRQANFAIDSTPFHVDADVSLPPPPAAGRISLGVRVDPIALESRLGCGPANGDGIRPAAVTIIGPKWATVTLGRVEQTADVCRSPALEPAHGDGRSIFRKLVDRLGVSAGYGATASGGTVYAGPSALVGVKLWP